VANERTGDDWAAELVRRVGLAVKEARGRKSAAWLSDRTAELGYRVSPTVIAKLDSGHRGSVLSVAELLILAAALDVPPLVLLYPDLPDGRVEIIPRHVRTSWEAYRWATGMDPSFLNPRTPSNGSQLVDAVRRRYESMAELAHLHVERSKARNDMAKKSLEARQTEVSGQIGRLNALINDVGGVLKDAQTEDEARGTRPDQ
jgi:hypothetical protein